MSNGLWGMLENLSQTQSWCTGHFFSFLCHDALLIIILRQGPLTVFDSLLAAGDITSGIPVKTPGSESYWSQYYRSNSRDPSKCNELSPWLASRLKGMCLVLHATLRNHEALIQSLSMHMHNLNGKPCTVPNAAWKLLTLN